MQRSRYFSHFPLFMFDWTLLSSLVSQIMEKHYSVNNWIFVVSFSFVGITKFFVFCLVIMARPHFQNIGTMQPYWPKKRITGSTDYSTLTVYFTSTCKGKGTGHTVAHSFLRASGLSLHFRCLICPLLMYFYQLIFNCFCSAA